MKKIEIRLFFSENTIKWAKEKASKQGIDISTYLKAKIENEVFKEYVEGKFEPIRKGYKNEKKKDKNKRN